MNEAQRMRALLDDADNAPAETGEKARVKIDGAWHEVNPEDIELPTERVRKETSGETARIKVGGATFGVAVEDIISLPPGYTLLKPGESRQTETEREARARASLERAGDYGI